MNWVKTKRKQIVNMLVLNDPICNRQINLWEYTPWDNVTGTSFEFGVVVNTVDSNWFNSKDSYTLVFNSHNVELSSKFKDYLQGVLDEKYLRVDDISLIIGPGHRAVDIHFEELFDNIFNLGVSLE